MVIDVDTTGSLTGLYRAHIAALQAAYEVVLHAHGLDAIVLHTGTPQKKSVFDDQFWPLVTVPHTKHWIALNVADCAVVVATGKKPRLLLNVERDFWEQPAPSHADHAFASFDVHEVPGHHAMRGLMPIGRTAFVGEDRARAHAWGFADTAIAPAELLRDLDALRVKKTEYEVHCLREANRIAARGHRAVLDAFHSGDASELELHLLYLRATQQDDPETPYKNIVALGEHAATLHHVSYGRSATAAQSLLLDAGATYLGYDSDITRTAVKGKGAAVDVFAALVAGVDGLQKELCARVKEGLPYEQLHDESHQLLASVLLDTGIAKAGTSAAALVDDDITRKLFPHGLGHSLGIQTHDVGCRNTAPAARNPFLRNTTPIATGQVFTIEPGCYFIPDLLEDLRTSDAASLINWPLVDALVPLGGVRIEDDLRVIPGGVENLTRTYLP